MKCTASIGDVVDGASEHRERLHEVCVFSVENDLIFVVIAARPRVISEEVMDECGRILHGRVGEIESGGHGGRVFLWGVCGFCGVRPCHQIYLCGFVCVSSLNK